MSSYMNKRFAQAMTTLEANNPEDYYYIRDKITALKTEAATWRRRAQAQTPSVETTKKPLTEKRDNS